MSQVRALHITSQGRFPWLKNILVRLRDRKSMEMICDYLTACVLLHNLLQNCEYQEEWIDEKFCEIDDDDELNTAIVETIDAPTDIRRAELLSYLAELVETNIN